MRNKILVVGGAFNPPTVAHIDKAFEIITRSRDTLRILNAYLRTIEENDNG